MNASAHSICHLSSVFRRLKRSTLHTFWASRMCWTFLSRCCVATCRIFRSSHSGSRSASIYILQRFSNRKRFIWMSPERSPHREIDQFIHRMRIPNRIERIPRRTYSISMENIASGPACLWHLNSFGRHTPSRTCRQLRRFSIRCCHWLRAILCVSNQHYNAVKRSPQAGFGGDATLNTVHWTNFEVRSIFPTCTSLTCAQN